MSCSFLGEESLARGILVGLLAGDGASSALLLVKRMPAKALERETSREDNILLTWEAVERAPLFVTEKSIRGEGDTGFTGLVGYIRLDLASSLGWARFPCDVAGLGAACPLRSLARDVLGRARVDAGGRMPELTLAENDEFEVWREWFDVFLED